MTDFQYIKFTDTPSTPDVKKKNNRKAKILKTILFFIPESNPEWNSASIEVMKKSVEHLDPKDRKKLVDKCSAEIRSLFFESRTMKNLNWRWNALLEIARVLVSDGSIT